MVIIAGLTYAVEGDMQFGKIKNVLDSGEKI